MTLNLQTLQNPKQFLKFVTTTTFKDVVSDTAELIDKLDSISEEAGCEKCDKGFIKSPGGVFYKTSICDCKKERDELLQLLENIEESGIPKGLKKMYPLKKFKAPEVPVQVLEFIANEEDIGWLYLAGNRGTGKTYLAIVIAQIMQLSGNSILFQNVPKLMDSLRPSAENNSREIMSACEEVDLLVLDDLGQEKYSEWVLERLYIIINERYSNGRKTIFTSNIPFDKLEDKLPHKAIVSRMYQLCSEIGFSGKDMRYL